MWSGQSEAATRDLALTLDFIQDRFADQLTGLDQDHHHQHHHASVKQILSQLDYDTESRSHSRRRRGVDVDCCMVDVADCLQYSHALVHSSDFTHSSAVCRSSYLFITPPSPAVLYITVLLFWFLSFHVHLKHLSSSLVYVLD